MEPSKPTYHRVDLEERLLDAAATIITTRGIAAFSLRALGDAAQVSRSAPYHYFADKEALLQRLGERGFMEMHAAIAAAAGHFHRPEDRLRAGFCAMLEFALTNAGLFGVMFANVLERDQPISVDPSGDLHPFSSEAAIAAFRTMMDGVAALGVADHALLGTTHAFWSAAHGVAVLANGGHLKRVSPHDVLNIQLDALLAKVR